MARLNWLVQRAVLETEHAERLTAGKVWVDCGPGYGTQSLDAYGNAGYQDKTSARAALVRIRKVFPADSYRLIRIVE